MSNAAKHRKKAAEFEQLKQIDRAIAAYIKAIEESESAGEDVDVALLNKVGDLTLRQGRIADAVTYYERAVEHYATAGLFNNAIALCNKILRSAPGRANVYFTLGRICAKKGLRGDATRNFLEYATRMQQEGRVEEGMRALAEVADLAPELTEVRRLVEEHAERVGIALPKRRTPIAPQAAQPADPRRADDKTSELIFLDVGMVSSTRRDTPPLSPRVPTPVSVQGQSGVKHVDKHKDTPAHKTPAESRPLPSRTASTANALASLDEFLLFDPSRPELDSSASISSVATIEIVDAPDTVEAVAHAPTMLPVPAVHQVVERVAQPAVEPVAEPIAEPVADSVADSVAESAVDNPLDHVSDSLPATLAATLLESNIEPASELSVESGSVPSVATVIESIELEATVAPLGEAPVGTADLAAIAPLPQEVTPPAVAAVVEPVFEPVRDDVIALTPVMSSIVPATLPTDQALEGLEQVHTSVEASVELLDELHVTHEVSVSNDLLSNNIQYVAGLTSVVELSPQTDVEASDVSTSTPAQVDGLEVMGELRDHGAPTLDGLTSDEFVPMESAADHETEPAVTWLVPTDVTDAVNIAVGLVATHEEDASVTTPVDALTDLVIEDFDNAAGDALDVSVISADSAQLAPTPAYGSPISRKFTPLDVSPIPELDAAIEAGALAAALAEADPEIVLRRPPFRIDPHDFILPGELPPLLVDDALVDAGLLRSAPSGREVATQTADFAAANTSANADLIGTSALGADDISATNGVGFDAVDDVADTYFADDADAPDPLVTPGYTVAITSESIHRADTQSADDVVEASTETPAFGDSLPAELSEAVDETDLTDAEAALRATIEQAAPFISESGVADPTDDVRALSPASETPQSNRSVSTTPSLPIAAVAAEANAVASSRRDELVAAVAQAPQDWILRRRLAEAMFEVGEREAGLAELQAALMGFSQGGHFGAAADIADELLRISPERISYHQKRVELAVRLNDQQRLRVAYLDLGDTLSTGGDEVRAHAVYARVLEIDPWDERARAALGAAAPPPPPKPTPDDEHVDLTAWLRDDGPENTRMRMREPEVSGDEQADFDALLKHFKDGVARSLGEEDYESHYDLGVAYKEMGLTDDAIAEFQKALRSRRHRLPAYEALGQCFVEQSRYSIAATVLTRALHEPGLGDENRVGVLYLLAYSCEALQRWDEARSYYTRVYATDINFRDVAARLAAIDQLAR